MIKQPMIKTFTQNDLVQYLYDELPTRQRHLLEDAMMADQDLAEDCADLLLAHARLQEAYAQPSDRVTNAIMQYSKNLSLHP